MVGMLMRAATLERPCCAHLDITSREQLKPRLHPTSAKPSFNVEAPENYFKMCDH
jgi:hypothetical protein